MRMVTERKMKREEVWATILAAVRLVKEVPQSLLIFPSAAASGENFLLLLPPGGVPGVLELHHLLLHINKERFPGFALIGRATTLLRSH